VLPAACCRACKPAPRRLRLVQAADSAECLPPHTPRTCALACCDEAAICGEIWCHPRRQLLPKRIQRPPQLPTLLVRCSGVVGAGGREASGHGAGMRPTSVSESLREGCAGRNWCTPALQLQLQLRPFTAAAAASALTRDEGGVGDCVGRHLWIAPRLDC
jgi:hypothetical protein